MDLSSGVEFDAWELLTLDGGQRTLGPRASPSPAQHETGHLVPWLLRGGGAPSPHVRPTLLLFSLLNIYKEGGREGEKKIEKQGERRAGDLRTGKREKRPERLT